ncbi:methionyl-tRNA formyltransferase [Croceiramulus getboli]|nr:methionyl-tRNA formyltransferase [Flavobacteriaceae bacterium YJPT1-3]
MRELRIVFMGTPDFAVSSLKALEESEWKVVGVITAPDRKAGRGRKLQSSAVKQYAESVGLPVLQPTNLKDESFIDELKALKPNLQVVVAFRMLPEVVWRLPEYGTFNLHASLLPQYRGAAPINWAVIQGEQESGVTTFYIDDKIDTGDLLLQARAPIEKTDTAGTLHDRLAALGSRLVLETVEAIAADQITPQPQRASEVLRAAPKLNKDNTRIDWDAPATVVYNFIRGLSPYPAAWSALDQDGELLPVKIYKVSFTESQLSAVPGTLQIENNTLLVAVADGCLQIDELQLPGKRKMNSKDLLNGFEFKENAILR